MLVCVRTCPYQSWRIVAELEMSTLNLALQNVSERFEQLVKNKNSLSAVREAIQKCPELCSALRDPMAYGNEDIHVGKSSEARITCI